MSPVSVRPFTIADYDTVHALWRSSEGVGLNESDSREAIARFLERNQELSFVAEDMTGIVGAVLCSHDGRRGYLHHLAVAKSHCRRGIARTLVQSCLANLQAAGIPKCNVFLFRANAVGREFWEHEGWKLRDDLVLLQKTT